MSGDRRRRPGRGDWFRDHDEMMAWLFVLGCFIAGFFGFILGVKVGPP